VRQLLFQGEKDSDKCKCVTFNIEVFHFREITFICACSFNLVMVKISLMERGAVVGKRRTKCVRRENAAALFEEKFIFSIQPKSLFSDESSCLIQLFSRTRIGLHIFSILMSNSSFRLSFDHFLRYQKMSWKNEFSTA